MGARLFPINCPADSNTIFKMAKDAGAYDATLNLILPENVIDYCWENDDTLEWVKTRTKDYVRSNPYGPEDTTREIVTITTSQFIAEYVWEWRSNEPEPKNDLVIEPVIKKHGLGACPILPLRVPGLWAGDRLISPIVDLLNCEATIRWWVTLQGPSDLDERQTQNVSQERFQGLQILASSENWNSSRQSGDYEAMNREVEKAKDSLMSTLQVIARRRQSTRPRMLANRRKPKSWIWKCLAWLASSKATHWP